VCTAAPTAGQPCPQSDCADGSSCEFNGGDTPVCIAPKAAGSPCNFDRHCQAGLACIRDENYDNGVCRRPADEGESCDRFSPDTVCRRFDNRCDATNRCAPLPDEGESCPENRCRGDLYCGGNTPRCSPAVAAGESCGNPAYTMSRSVRRFRAMLDEDLSEDDYRKFIATHWKVLLGPEYKDCRSPYEVSRAAILVLRAEQDLFAVRHDDSPDLWELKRPQDPVFRRYNDWRLHSEATAKAFGQMIDYCDLVRRDPQVVRSYEARKGLGAVQLSRPRGFVVIGRYTGSTEERKAQRDRVRLENSYYAGLTLMTYDDLVERAEQFIGFLRGYRPTQ
jgi:hypothetical protein